MPRERSVGTGTGKTEKVGLGTLHTSARPSDCTEAGQARGVRGCGGLYKEYMYIIRCNMDAWLRDVPATRRWQTSL